MKKQRWSLLISQKICCGSTSIVVNPCEYIHCFYSIAIDFSWWSATYLFKGDYLKSPHAYWTLIPGIFFPALSALSCLAASLTEFEECPFLQTCCIECIYFLPPPPSVCQGQGWRLRYSGSWGNACRVCPWRLPQCCGFPSQPLLQTAWPNHQQLHFPLGPGTFISLTAPQQHPRHLDTHSACTQPVSSVQPQSKLPRQTQPALQPICQSDRPQPEQPLSQSPP